MTTRRDDPGFIEFVKRIGVGMGALIGTATVLGFIWTTATSGITRAISTEVRSRVVADSVTYRAMIVADSVTNYGLERLAAIVELSAVIVAEQPGSQERKEAVEELRKMRRFHPL